MTQLAGLSTTEAAESLRHHGPNELPSARRRSLATRVGAQLRDPMILLLLGACLVTVGMGDQVDTIVILAVIVLNTALGVSQEIRAERALLALRDLAAPTCRAFRDGVLVELATRDVVPGDLIQLDAGDVIPADGRLDDAFALQVDEAAVTGESVPVERDVGDEVKAGTVVTRGRARLEVLRTGPDSALGQIAQLVASAPARATPLQRRLTRLSRTLVAVAGIAGAVVFVLGVARGVDMREMLVIAVSLAVAAVPESLPAVVAVALALGAYRMAQRSAIVRSLPAVETLGSVSVIASDKTGTLTEGRMTARRVWTPAGVYSVTGLGYGPEGRLEGADDIGADRDLVALLRAGALCNDASLVQTDDGTQWRAIGDPLEAALLALGPKGGIDPGAVRESWPRVGERPFDSQNRTMTTWHRSADGSGSLRVVKGAPERVLALITDDASRVNAQRSAQEMAQDGLRVIAIAEARACQPSAAHGNEEQLRLLGLVGIQDPARDSARQVIAACQRAGVQVVMVTGDHPATARAVAADVGITDGSPDLIEGTAVETDAMPALGSVGVFARTLPQHKVAIVEALQEGGRVVAVTGDGVNDAPALRAADIGVAMGHGGTEVARQAADLVLADDNLGTIVVAIEEGRRILANIRRFLCYALSGGFAEILVLLLAPFFGIAIPLLPAQILWINMITHGLPGVAFGAEPVDPGVMSRPSPSPDESVLGRGLGRQIAVGGTLIGAITLVAAILARELGQPVTVSIFVVLGMAQLGLALALRAPRAGRAVGQRGLELAVLGAAALQLAAVYVSPLQALLHTEALGMWIVALVAFATLPALVVRVLGRRI